LEYTVTKLSRLSGISPRSIRFLGEVGILKPAKINSCGYRIYSQTELELLQLILIYRKLGFSLEKIKSIINQPDFNVAEALLAVRSRLIARRNNIENLIQTINKTVASYNNLLILTDSEKFKGLNGSIAQEEYIPLQISDCE
jgi:DNA-binding transcriptional MerR regulator